MTTIVRRNPRIRTEDCDHCGGTGKVHHREIFSLWTADEWEHVPIVLNQKHNVPTNSYLCKAVPGGNIQDACREAVSIASMVDRPVAFEFNGVVVVARKDDDPGQLVRRWGERLRHGP